MATVITVRFTGKVLQDGTCPVMLKIQKGATKKHYSLGFSANERQWDNTNRCFVRDKRINPTSYSEDETGRKIEIDGYAIKNTFIDKKRLRAQEIIDEFDRNNIDWTLQMFEDKFINDTRKVLVYSYLRKHIESLKEEKRFGNAKAYSQLLTLLECFSNEKHIKINKMYFHDLNYSVINKLYLYLKNDRQVSGNTMSIYLRTLRSLMNLAISDGCGSKEAYCFSNGRSDSKKTINIGKLKEETKKRFIPIDYLSVIKNTVFDKEPLEYSRRLFLLSFYLYGCSYIDLANLKVSDIKQTITKDGKQVEEIEYTRSKTHKVYSIQMRNEIKEQIDWFRLNYPTIGDYLLPCVTRDLKDAELYNHIVNRRKKFNNRLKEIVKELNFPESLLNISTYYSRHSYAMAMLTSGRSTETISQALGHEDLKTTKIYLDSFSSDFLANESDGLI